MPSPITCHVLDSTSGTPAAQVAVSLTLLSKTDAEAGPVAQGLLAEGVTNADGRCTDLLDSSQALPAGVYQMVFHTGKYFERRGVETFYPVVER